MESLTTAIDNVLRLLASFSDAVIGVLGQLESWLREQLTLLGVAPQVQTVLLTVAALVLVLLAARMLAGVIRIAIVCILVLIGLHILLPILST